MRRRTTPLGDRRRLPIGDVEPTAGRPATAQTDVEGPFTRRRHAGQAGRRRHDRPRRAAAWSGPTRSRPATRSRDRHEVRRLDDDGRAGRTTSSPRRTSRSARTLRIPPVTGLIVTVAATDTLDGIAAKYSVDGTDILATNGLTTRTLVVGQVLVLPGAEGKADPEAAGPAVDHASHGTVGGGGGGIAAARRPTTAGKFLWPVVGGGNYISQYFHYGHYAIDIAADYGSTVRAAAAGTVTFAGWKNNGGGYQVWIAHGSNLYTTYNHMSAITVGRGQHVGRGQQVGRIGQSGNATGPHSTSRSGAARSGTAARASTRSATSRPRPPAADPAPTGARHRSRARMAPMFLDRVKIWVRAGDGGDGAATFRQEAHVPRGGPDGGDGGRGGSVYLRVDAGQTTLRDFNHRHHFRATPGGRGTRARRHGKAGDDLVLDVPPGTAVYDDESGALVADLVARRPEHDGRPRRARRPRQHALQDVDAPGPQARPEGRAGRRGMAPSRAPADRRHRAGRAARTPASPRSSPPSPRRPRRSPTTRSRRSSRTSASWTSATRTSDDRRSPTSRA